MASLGFGSFFAVALAPSVASAYVGPGAGVAFVTTTLLLVVTVMLSLFGLLLWPIRRLWRLLTLKRPARRPRIRRAVIIGLDGLDPEIVRQLMQKGKLPAMRALAEQGILRDLATTLPAMSPVAWSTFATGVNPSRHGIFDFITRNPATYSPELTSVEIEPPRRTLSFGAYQIPLGKPGLRSLRGSKSFWKVLGEYGIPSSVLRVPITFPPERFAGLLLSAMCVPDLLGTQGSFTYFTTSTDENDGRAQGGRRVRVVVEGDRISASLEGPENPIRRDRRTLRRSFTLRLLRNRQAARLHIGGRSFILELGRYSDWIPIEFPLGLGLKLRGVCRFRLLGMDPALRLYVTPINIDPARPILPISHPFAFSVFLAKLLGRYATLGLAEDTWALNEGVLDEEAFLEQAWSNHAEREAMLLAMLGRTPRGLTVCVFDGTDRIQHMFMRQHVLAHSTRLPGARESSPPLTVVEETYSRADSLVGRVVAEVGSDPRTLVLVVSDHGFKLFRRGINLNAWLHENHYLFVEEGKDGSGEWLRDVDWSRTRAYAIGLAGLFLNVKGREGRGVVESDDAPALANEIANKLSGLVDPLDGAIAIRRAWPAHAACHGPYADRAPDVIVGYAAGWRASWTGARGVASGPVFEDNLRAWSGDHCIDPEEVPGVLIANHRLGHNGEQPAIADLAPTVLDLFGIPTPRYMDGRSLA
ncbi:MAG: alkaline phosphatase family protein, partial [Pseudomonadota bacterium]